jgi:hypothetical protein
MKAEFLSVCYKVVQIWPEQFVCKQVTVCPGHIWTTLYMSEMQLFSTPGKVKSCQTVL